MSQRTAYFIMAHHKPYQFEWLMGAVYNPQDLFLIHVDAKSLLGLKKDRAGIYAHVKAFCVGKPNVRLLRPRFTNWGGWSLSRILLDAIAVCLKEDPDWRYFVNLSGQCYPLQPMAAIRERLTDQSGPIFVEMRPWDSLPDDDWHLKWHPMFETPVRAFIRSGRKAPPSDFRIVHKGSQWVMLPRDFCAWMLSSDALKRISRYMKTLLLTDELIIQALVDNGPFENRVAPHYGREIIWPGPKVLGMEDADRLLPSASLFARKFDAERDVDILNLLAERNRFVPGPAAQSIEQANAA